MTKLMNGTIVGRPAGSLLLVVAALCLTGCGTPEAVKTHDYLTDYDRMVQDYDPRLSLVYPAEAATLDEGSKIVIGTFELGGDRVTDPELAEGFAENLRYFLRYHLANEQGRFSLSMDPDTGAPAPGEVDAYKVEGKITVFDDGNGWARYFSGLLFLGLGATDFQVEGRVTDLRSGETVMEFVDRRRHLGNTPFGPNPKNLADSQFAMRQTVYHTAGGLAYVLCHGKDAIVEEDEDDEQDDGTNVETDSDTAEETL